MSLLLRSTIETPVGPMLALVSDEALAALEFIDVPSDANRHEGERVRRLDARLRRWYGSPRVEDGANGITDRVREWLAGYFAGTSADAGTLPLAAAGGTFERRVWDALRAIPPGATVSYGEIARRIGAPAASRAVGLANGANPIAIIVPCHRVIGSNGSLTGYGGGLDRKAWLLNHERRWRNALPLWLTDDLRAPASARVQAKGG